MTQPLRLTDTTLRDGSHAIHYSYTIEQVHTIVNGLDEAGIPVIEASHGAGLAGSTIQQGFSTIPEFDLLAEALHTAKRAKIAVLLVPGIGTTKELLRAAAMGLHIVRIAVHCTEADISQQHFESAKKAGLEAVGFLMMAHSQPPVVLAEQAKLMESYGADSVYVVDSAGAMLPHEAAARVKALCEAISIPVGFHAHNNLGVAVGNTLAAIEAGASQVDGTLRSRHDVGTVSIEKFFKSGGIEPSVPRRSRTLAICTSKQPCAWIRESSFQSRRQRWPNTMEPNSPLRLPEMPYRYSVAMALCVS